MTRASLILFLLLSAPAAMAGEDENIVLFGNEQLSVDDLLEAARDDLDRFRRRGGEAEADDAAFEIRRHYLREGFPRATVEPRLKGPDVEFVIVEGPRVHLAGVKVTGVEDGEAEKLSALVRVPRSGFLGGKLFVRAALESSVHRMRAWLRQLGYLDAEVSYEVDPAVDEIEGEEGEVTARYQVVKGRLARTAKVTLLGVRTDFLAGLEKEVRELEGRPFSPLTPFELQGAVADFYGQRGYPFAESSVAKEMRENEDEVSVDLVLAIVEGPPARVRRVELIGNVRTKDRTVRRELEFSPGDEYDSRALGKSLRHLYATSLFRQVNIRLVRPDDQEAIEGEPVDLDLEVRMEENDFKRLETSLGFGSWELFRGSIGVSWLNLAGTGRTLSAEVKGSVRGFGTTLSAADPWLFGERVAGTGNLSYETQERPTFRFRRTGVGVGATEILDQGLIGSLGFRFDATEVTKATGDLPEEFENSTNLSTVTLGLVREARDDPWSPSRGYNLSGSLQIALKSLGGDLDFLRLRLEGVKLFPLGKGLTLLLHGELGAMRSFVEADDLPVQERFYLGGGQTVRSFDESDLGPRQTEHVKSKKADRETAAAAGGEFFSLFNLELRVPVWGKLEAAIFADAGNVIEDFADTAPKGYRYALGTGLRFQTPLGPARIDFGVNPSPKDFEDRWAIFLAVGYPF